MTGCSNDKENVLIAREYNMSKIFVGKVKKLGSLVNSSSQQSVGASESNT
jgi:hypothetical protein